MDPNLITAVGVPLNTFLFIVAGIIFMIKNSKNRNNGKKETPVVPVQLLGHCPSHEAMVKDCNDRHKDLAKVEGKNEERFTYIKETLERIEGFVGSKK